MQVCRFCRAELPDWRVCWDDLPKADPVMTVAHEGKTYQVVVQAGPEGKAAFERTIRDIFGLSDSDTVSLTFGCSLPPCGANPAAPGIPNDVTLNGWESFDAAVFCASLSAGQRRQRRLAAAAAAAALPGAAQAPASTEAGRPTGAPQSAADTTPMPNRKPPMDSIRRALGRACDAIIG